MADSAVFEIKFLAQVAEMLGGTRQVQDDLKKTGAEAQALGDKFTGLQKIIGGVVGALGTYFAASQLSDYIDKAREANKAQGLLTDTLKTSGQYSADYRAELDRQQQSIGALTKTGETQMAGIQQQLLFYGASRDNVEDLTRITLRFAKLSGGDVPTALGQVTRALGTGTYQIRGYHLEIDKAATAEQKMAQFIDQMKARVGELGAVTGGVKSFGYSMDGLKVAIGRVLDIPVQAYYRGAAEGVENTRQKVVAFTRDNSTLKTVLEQVGYALGRTYGQNFEGLFGFAAATAGIVAFVTAAKTVPVVVGTMSASLGYLGGALAVVYAAFAGFQIGGFVGELQIYGVKVTEWGEHIALGWEVLFSEIGNFTETMMVKVKAAIDRAFTWIQGRVTGIVAWVSSTLASIGSAAAAAMRGENPAEAWRQKQQEAGYYARQADAKEEADNSITNEHERAELARLKAEREKALDELALKRKWIEDDITARQQEEARAKPKSEEAAPPKPPKPPKPPTGGGDGGGGGGKGGGADRADALADAAADRERATALEHIRNLLIDIRANPFRTDSDKLPEEQRLLREEEAQLRRNIQARLDYIAAHGNDPAFAKKVADYGKENERDQRELNKNAIQQQETTFGGQFQKGMVQFQNQQTSLGGGDLAKAFTDNWTTAFSTVSTGLTGLITKTGNWKQTFQGGVNAMVGSLVQLGIRFVQHYAMLAGQMVAHAVLGSSLKTKDVAETAAAASAKTAALTPAVLLESIVTYGVAAAIGLAAMLAAMAVVGGFAEGGVVPGAPAPTGRDNTLGILPGGALVGLAGGEGIITNRAMAHYGGGAFVARLNNLELGSAPLPAAARLAGAYAAGGVIGGGAGYSPTGAARGPAMGGGAAEAPAVHFHMHQSEEAMHRAMASTRGRNITVDTISGSAVDFGLNT